jgi:hypothetical protein
MLHIFLGYIIIQMVELIINDARNSYLKIVCLRHTLVGDAVN